MIDTLDRNLIKAVASFKNKIALVSSFGLTSMVIIDRLSKLDIKIPVFSIDTGELFPQTYQLCELVAARYNLDIRIVKADKPTDRLWQTDPDACCKQRKVDPLAVALIGFDAWITGLRRDQSSTRADQKMIDYDAAGRCKIAPLIEWTQKQTWAYLHANEVPYNALHDQGYGSIGCTHCTRPSAGAERSGRWVGMGDKTECGIHLAGVR